MYMQIAFIWLRSRVTVSIFVTEIMMKYVLIIMCIVMFLLNDVCVMVVSSYIITQRNVVCNVLLQIVIGCQMTVSTLELAAVKHK